MDESVQVVIDEIAACAGRPAVLEDTQLQLIAFSTHTEATDLVRGASILRREASPEVRSYLMRFVRDAVEPLRVPAHEPLSMAARLCVPIVRDRRPVGYVWFVDPDEAITPEQVRRCSELAASVADSVAHAHEARAADPSVALAALLAEPERADALGSGLQGRHGDLPYAIAVIGTVGESAPATTVRRALAAAVRDARVIDAGRRVVHAVHDGRCVAMLPGGPGVRTMDLLDDLIRLTQRSLRQGRPDTEVVAGVGAARIALREAASAFHEAVTVLRALEVFGELRPIGHWERLGTFELPVRLASDPAPRLHPGLAALADDAESLALLETLEVYLDVAGNVQTAAQRLNLHRTSLYHRLRRIERLAGVDLKDGVDRLAVHLSIKVARIRGEYRPRSHQHAEIAVS